MIFKNEVFENMRAKRFQTCLKYGNEVKVTYFQTAEIWKYPNEMGLYFPDKRILYFPDK